MLKTCTRRSASGRTLADLDREYTLNEIAIITRAGPARILGLKHKGHLGPGADADITIYTPHENKETMFELPRLRDQVGPRDRRARRDPRPARSARRCTSRPSTTATSKPTSQEWFEKYYSIRLRNYPVDAELPARGRSRGVRLNRSAQTKLRNRKRMPCACGFAAFHGDSQNHANLFMIAVERKKALGSKGKWGQVDLPRAALVGVKCRDVI